MKCSLRQWALAARLPLVGPLLARRGVRSWAARADADPELARGLSRMQQAELPTAAWELSRRVLQTLQTSGAIDAVIEEWVQRRDPALADLLRETEWVATSDPRLRVLSSLLVDFTEGLRSCAPGLVVHVARAADDPDAAIARAAREVLADLREHDSREELCRLVVREGLPAAREVVVDAHFAPSEASDRALFYLLTGQWGRYDALDFDRKLLGAAYNAADRELRRAAVAAIRRAGRMDLTPALRGAARGVNTAGPTLSLPEAELLVEVLRDQGQWERLWGAVFDLSVIGSARAVRGLHRSGWRPPSPAERGAFDELVQIALDPLWDAPAVRRAAGMPLAPHAVLRVPAGVRDIDFAPNGTVLAVGAGDRSIRLWDFRAGEDAQVLGPYPGGVSHLTFTPDGTLVSVESNDPSREQVGLRAWSSGVERDLGTARSFVNGIAACGERRVLTSALYSSGLHVQVRETDTGRVLGSRHASTYGPGGGRPTTAVARDGSRVAIVAGGGRLDTYRLADLEPLSLPGAEVRGVVERLAFAPDDASVLVGEHTGEVHEFRWDGDRLVSDPHPLLRHRGAIRGLCGLRAGSAILTVCDRDVRATSWLDRESLGNIPHGLTRVQGIAVSHDEEWLAIAEPDAVAVWDLRLLGIFLLSGSLSRAGPHHIDIIESAARDADLGRGERLLLRYLLCVLKHRFRFAVALDEQLDFEPGSADIDIDIE